MRSQHHGGQDRDRPSGAAGIAQIFERYRDRVVVTDPIEASAPYGTQLRDAVDGHLQLRGMAGEVPRYFNLLEDGRYEEAMEIYWQMHPIRQADAEVIGEASAGPIWSIAWCGSIRGGYTGSTAGRSDSPISHQRSPDATLRAAAVASGLPITDDPDSEFLVGRNPR